jgi:hypothetical protein
MLRKTVTLLELIVIGFLLVMGVVVFANRSKPQPLVYPAAAVVRAALPLPPDTPRTKQTVPDFSRSTQRLLDSLILKKDKSKSKRFSRCAQALIDSAMQVESVWFFQQHPRTKHPAMQSI